jgi:hypothetical protein
VTIRTPVPLTDLGAHSIVHPVWFAKSAPLQLVGILVPTSLDILAFDDDSSLIDMDHEKSNTAVYRSTQEFLLWPKCEPSYVL